MAMGPAVVTPAITNSSSAAWLALISAWTASTSAFARNRSSKSRWLPGRSLAPIAGARTKVETYVLAAAAIAAVLVIAGVPLATLLPFALLLVCPLMMVFMMRGMGGMHRGGDNHSGYGCEHDTAAKAEPPAGRPR